MTDPGSHDPRPDGSERPASTALVLVGGSERSGPQRPALRSFAITRHNSSFVTQLIATAAHVPQTRILRRASPEDAQSSYRAALGKNRPAARPVGTSRVA